MPTPNTKDCCDKCECLNRTKDHGLFCDFVCHKKSCTCHTPRTESEEWEKEFDETYGCHCDDREVADHTRSTACRGALDTDEIKSFIRAEKEKSYKEGRGVKENITTLRLEAESKGYAQGYKEGELQGAEDEAIRCAEHEAKAQIEGYSQALKDVREGMPTTHPRNTGPANTYGYDNALAELYALITRLDKKV